MQSQPYQPRLTALRGHAASPSPAPAFDRGRRKAGLALVEVLAVMAIVAVLTAVAWMAIAGRVKQGAKQAQIKADMRQVIVAVNLYRNDNDGGLPSNWQHFGYYRKVPKGGYGDGYPLQDVYNPHPPSYDVSYHTPECAQPPKANMAFYMFRQAVAKFESRPRANTLDVEHDQAALFLPACLANSYAERHIKIMQGGALKTPRTSGYKSLGANLAGTLSYHYYPDWFTEAATGF